MIVTNTLAMDHLHIPDSCKPQAITVPYLGYAPRYDLLGFEGFPERHSINSEDIISSHSFLPWRKEWIESFLQEWLWFGLMHEFTQACGIEINVDDFVAKGHLDHDTQVMSTASLLEHYVRQAVVKQLELEALAMALPKDDLLNMPDDPTKELVVQIIDYWYHKMTATHAQVSSETQTAQAQIQPESAAAPDDHDVAKPSPAAAPGSNHRERQENKLSTKLLCDRVNTARIARYIMAGGDPSSRGFAPQNTRVRLAECVTRVQKILYSIVAQKDPVLRFEILLAIGVLCDTVVKVVWSLFEDDIQLRSVGGFDGHFEKMMIDRGWCPSRAASIAAQPYWSSAYIAALLPSYQGESHRGCRPRKCLRQPSTVGAIEPRHRPQCTGTCGRVSVDESQLINILNSGGIPGFRQVSGRAQLGHKIVNCMEGKFVAISHVWAHGLGNPSRNELPSCQINFLCSAVRRCAGHDAILWVDTLSVPIQAQWKRIAISRLRAVYGQASQVLVIDNDLMQVGDDSVEQILQLLGSEWQRRLWTLQEGRLAQELLIQFKTRAVSLGELERSASQVPNGSLFNPLAHLSDDLRSRFSRREDVTERFQDLVVDLAPRTVTVRTDEPVCLATLLNLPLEPSVTPTMVDIYRLAPALPQDLIFQDQPRLSVPGLRWAPATFLETEFVLFPADGGFGRLSPQGLHIEKNCIVLDNDFVLRRDPSSSSEVYIIHASDGRKYAIVAPDYFSADGMSVRKEIARVICKAMVVFEKSEKYFHRISKAVLVSCVDEGLGDNVTYCHIELRLNVWRADAEHADFHTHMCSHSGRVLDTISGRYVPSKKLCVD